LWILFGKRFNAIGKKILLVGIPGLLLYLFLYNLIPAMLIEQEITGLTQLEVVRSSDSGRIYLWQLAIETMLNHPLFGVGPLMYSAVSHSSNHPHNSLLWLISEWGLIASISLISLVLYLLYLYLKRIHKFSAYRGNHGEAPSEELVISYSLALSLIAATLHSLVSGLYIIPSSLLVGLPIIILAVSAYKALEENKDAGTSSQSVIVLPLRAKLVVTIFLIALLIPTYNYYMNSLWSPEENYKGYMQPGYWLNGDA
jgi:O-antigen ligase